MTLRPSDFPSVRGRLQADVSLKPYTWLRVGGKADILFMPADEADLAHFLSATPDTIPIHVLGAGSNLLVRDGGVRGVVIKLGAAFSTVERMEAGLQLGAAALARQVAKWAAKMGMSGLEFYYGIPGSIGGTLRMNAGCYGHQTGDVVCEVVALDRRGRRCLMSAPELGYGYRHCAVQEGMIFVSALLRVGTDCPEAILARMQALNDQREKSQPIRKKTGGSTFKNPAADQSAWQLIAQAGGRGLREGGAMMSEQHCNFMINCDQASAADLENLGERVRTLVKARSGVDLNWEIRRIGDPL